MKNHSFSAVESLEPRIAPAAVLTFPDVDGDVVKITSSKGSNAALEAAVSTAADGMGFKINLIDLSKNPVFNGTSLKVVATTPAGGAGDGLVKVDRIDAADDMADNKDFGLNLGAIVVDGELRDIDAGKGTPGSKVAAIKVQSTADARIWTLGASVGSVVVQDDLRGSELNIAGSLGKLQIGGSLIGEASFETGYISVTGKIGSIRIGENWQGGSEDRAGSIKADRVGSITVGGDILGGAGTFSGRLDTQTIGPVKVMGDVKGGTGQYSGSLHAGETIKSIFIGGNIIGVGKNTAVVNALGSFTKSKIGSVRIMGSIVGGADFSGIVEGEGGIAKLRVGGDVKGGAGIFAGSVRVGNCETAVIAGSLIGGTANSSGTLSGGAIGSLTIGKDVLGGSVSGAASLMSAGSITFAKIGALEIGGSLVAGTDNSTGTLEKSGVVLAVQSIGSVHIGGDLTGKTGMGGITRAEIRVDGVAEKATGIASVRVDGNVSLALISVGSADGRIGTVKVAGNWTASSLTAGALPGGDGKIGTPDDAANTTGDNAALVSRIASVQIKGSVTGTAMAGDSYGFVAQQIGAFTVGANKLALKTGAGNDNVGTDNAEFVFGAFGDVRVRELAM